MAEKENGNFCFAIVTPMSGDLTIHDDRYTARSIEDGLNEGTLSMQADACDDFMITETDTGDEIATVDRFIAEDGYFTSYDFIPFD